MNVKKSYCRLLTIIVLLIVVWVVHKPVALIGRSQQLMTEKNAQGMVAMSRVQGQ